MKTITIKDRVEVPNSIVKEIEREAIEKFKKIEICSECGDHLFLYCKQCDATISYE